MTAGGATLVFRLVSFWLPLPVGGRKADRGPALHRTRRGRPRARRARRAGNRGGLHQAFVLKAPFPDLGSREAASWMRKLWVVSVAVLSGCILAACGGGSSSNSSGTGSGSTAGRGGTYKVGWEQAFTFTDNFDPTGEYLGDAMSIYSNLLIRTLVGYDHVAGTAGNKLVPDIATALPKPTNGGKTYAFTLKKGIRFGPPVNRVARLLSALSWTCHTTPVRPSPTSPSSLTRLENTCAFCVDIVVQVRSPLCMFVRPGRGSLVLQISIGFC